MNFKEFLLILPILFLTDQGTWYLIEKHYCKKNKYVCKNCKCWSCRFYGKVADEDD